ncbi:hypothetical protein ACWKWU_18685 [Chitinophaga lutea]
MKGFNIPMPVLLVAVLLTIFSCRKNEFPRHCPDRTPCRVVTYSFKGIPLYELSYTESGIPKQIILRFGGVDYNIAISYDGRRMVGREFHSHDTLLVMRLDECGRALSGYSYLNVANVRRQYTFEYDVRGKLTQHLYEDEHVRELQRYSYDDRGNVTSIMPELATGHKFLFTYDYSRPLNGRQIAFSDPAGWTDQTLELLKALDHIDLRPRDLPRSFESWLGKYRLTWYPYNDFVFDAQGNVLKYFSGNPADPAPRVLGISWGLCGGKPGK